MINRFGEGPVGRVIARVTDPTPRYEHIDASSYRFNSDGIPTREIREMLLDHSGILLDRPGEHLARANTVFIGTDPCGLGDGVASLRMAFAYARAMPDKQVTIKSADTIHGMERLATPPNVSFGKPNITRYDVTLSFDFRETFILCTSDKNANQFGSYESHLGLEGFARQVVRSRMGGTVPPGVNVQELGRLFAGRLLGLPIKQADITRPIVNLNPDLLASQRLWDILLVPEAYEKAGLKNRSIKSIAPEVWADVFELMRKHNFNGRLGIVSGHKWMQYVEEVASAAASAGLHANLVDTPTLDDFVDAVSLAGKYVGGDTGPTHLAVDVIRAARKQGVEIPMRQMYNGSVFPLDIYSILSHGDKGMRVLNYQGRKGLLATSRHGSRDITGLPADVVERFIMS